MRSRVFVTGALFLSLYAFAAAADSLLVASSPTDGSDPVTDSNTTRDVMKSVMGEVLPPASDPANLPEPASPGAELLQKYCVQCHELPGPGLHTAEEWPPVVMRMAERISRLSQRERGLIKLNEPATSDLTTLIAYLQKYGYKPMNVEQYPDLDTDIGQAFLNICEQCHALPDPSLHTAEEWRYVVLRMRQNMILLGKKDPGDDALAKAIGFLQAHARE